MALLEAILSTVVEHMACLFDSSAVPLIIPVYNDPQICDLRLRIT